MFRYFKKHFALAVLTALTSVAAQLAMPVSAVLEQNMVDFIIQGDMAGFRQILWYVALVVLGAALCYYLRVLTASKFRACMEKELRRDLYDSIMSQSAADFHRRDTAEYISMINKDVGMLGNNFSSPVFALVGVGFAAAASLAVMVANSPLLAMVAVVCSALSFLAPMALTNQIKKRIVESTERSAEMSLQLKEALNGHGVVSAFGLLPKIRKRFGEANSAYTEVEYKLVLAVSVMQNSSAVIGKLIKFITYLIAGHMAIQGRITVGTVLLFVSLYEYFSSGIMTFSQSIPLLRGSKPVIEKLNGIIDEGAHTPTGRIRPSFDEKIQVDGLRFSYREGLPVLRGLSLTLRKREKLALVGESGCGKSTLIKLLSGSYGDYKGSICYDGVELGQLDQGQLRQIVTVIHQDTYIFNETIRYNICLGETFPEADLRKALALSGVEKFLPQIDGGVDGSCGENGANLSGGQKQRIALARALIRNVDFLILDEGVSALDVETANEIEQELLDMEDLTLLSITHRIKDGLIEGYDRVLTMADGRIFEKEECRL